MIRTFKTALAVTWLALGAVQAQAGPVQDLLQEQGALIEESSRRTIGPAIEAIVDSGLERVQPVLQAWQDKALWIDAEGRFWRVIEKDGARSSSMSTPAPRRAPPTPPRWSRSSPTAASAR